MRRKLVVACVAIEMLAIALIWIGAARLMRHALEVQATAQAQEVLSLLEQTLAAPLAQRDYATVQQTLDLVRQPQGIQYLVLFDQRNRQIAISGWDPQKPLPPRDSGAIDLDRADQMMHLEAPIALAGQAIARLELGLSTQRLREARDEFRFNVLWIGVLALALSVLLLIVIASALTRNLAALSRASRQVAAGQYQVALPVHTRDEAGRLAAAFNTMAATIQERVAALEHSEQQQTHLLHVASQERARLSTLLGALQIGILFVDAGQRVVYANTLFSRLWSLNGLQPGTHLAEIVPLLTRQVDGGSTDLLERMLAQGPDQPFVDRDIVTRDARLIAQRMQVVGVGSDGQGGRIWLHEDITQSRQIAQRARLALFDSLTDLPNRRGLYEALDKALVQASASNRGLVLVFIDLDDFKHINDKAGHRVGDQILVEVAQALTQALNPGETVARLGGDEFAILGPGSTAKDAQGLALRLTQVVSALRFDVGVQSQAVGCSMGLALYPAHARSADDLIACADTAMYQAKLNGKNGWCLYRDDVAYSHAESERVIWNGRIYRALRDQRLQVHYQPVLRMSDMGIAYHEALLRMVDEDDATQLIAPAAFVQHAERSGKIRQIDRWVFETCIAMLSRSRASVRIAANLSPRSLDDAGFVGFLRDALQRYDVDPRRLHIELTETAAMGDLISARPMIAALRSVGCAVHLDDFGSGFSSFAHLKLLEVDGIKIDGNFVRDLTTDASNRLVVASLIEIARSLNKSTVAECVEDAATLEALRELGVDHVQGFHLGRPASKLVEAHPPDAHVRLVAEDGDILAEAGRSLA
ncbi:MAG: EAL domain-containing protein [Betaproteobacteria bacterium]